MSEQRLVDATELRRIFDVWLSEMNDNDPKDQQTGAAIYDCACQIDDAPTIDPNSLPAVKQLREEVAALKEQLHHLEYWQLNRKVVLESAAQDRAAVKVMRKRCEKTIAELRNNINSLECNMIGYKIFYDDVSSKGNCNNCGSYYQCQFAPRVGDTVRFNCPIWKSKEEK